MLRLAKLNFKNAVMTSETLFGLGMQVLATLFGGVLISFDAYGRFGLYKLCYLPWTAGVFITFALTIDNDSGAVRNRLIAGFSRLRIFLSQVLTAMLLSLVYYLVSLITVIILCHEIIGRNKTAGQLFLALSVTVCGFLVTAALAAVVSTVIFSRTGAVLSFILVIALTALFSDRLFESKMTYAYPDFGSDGYSDSSESYHPAAVRQGVKVFVFSSPVSQSFLYDLVVTQDVDNQIRNIEAYISGYESRSDAHGSNKQQKNDIENFRALLAVYEEQKRDLRLIPVYALAGAVLICAAGMLVYRKRNIE